MKKLFCLLALFVMLQAEAQQITDIEYFFDNDPGKGNGIAVPVGTPAATINDLVFTASTIPLSNGMHTLYARTKDNLGMWSVVNKQLIYKQPLSVAGNITKLEYFFDNDPGFGNANNISGFTPGTTINDFVFTADATALSNGAHFLYVRSKDDWSITNKILFYKQPITVAGNITKLEYFFDNDPGFGNASNISGFTPGTTINDFVFAADATALSNGPHFLYVRSKDDWSITNKILFYKQPLETTSNITQIEYFIDEDPGFGNGRQVSISPTNPVNDLVFSADYSGYANGQHYFFIRTKDANGRWSLTHASVYNQTVSLPLNWLRFTAQKRNTTSELNWTTANEQQVSHFDVERSINGITFDKIGNAVAKNGRQNDYAFTDINPIEGKNFYRIKRVDNDGKFTYSTIHLVDFVKKEKLISILNNPSANPIVKIESEKVVSIALFDATGKLLQKRNTNNLNILNLGDKLQTSGQILVVILGKAGLIIGVESVVVIK